MLLTLQIVINTEYVPVVRMKYTYHTKVVTLNLKVSRFYIYIYIYVHIVLI